MRKLLILVVLFSIVLYINAQNKNQADVRITLRDGSVFNGSTNLPTVDLVTKYGKLTIPFASVSYIEVGITPDKADESKIIDLVSKLSNESVDVRKAAYEELIKKNVGAIPIISNYIYSEKYQPSEATEYTVDGALSELKSKYEIDDNYSEEDIVSIDYQYIMGGTYSFKSIDLKTEFGTLAIPKDKMKKIEVIFIPGNESSAKNFILQASKHISGNTSGGWLKTGIMVKKGQTVDFIANGEVVLQSLSGGKYNPDGVAGTTTSYEYDDYSVGSTNTYPQYGNLVYKVGENGTALRAGSKCSRVVDGNGNLYISIYETVYNSANTGSYSVKVNVK